MTTNNTKKTNYTFLNMKRSLKPVNGQDTVQISCTAIGVVSNLDPQLKNCNNGNAVIGFRIPLNNVHDYIQKTFGVCPTPDGNGALWPYVNVYGKQAENFFNYMSDKRDKSVTVVITGFMSIENKTDKNNRVWQNIIINADNVQGVKVLEKKQNGYGQQGQNQSYNAPNQGYGQAPQAPAYNAAPGNAPGFAQPPQAPAYNAVPGTVPGFAQPPQAPAYNAAPGNAPGYAQPPQAPAYNAAPGNAPGYVKPQQTPAYNAVPQGQAPQAPANNVPQRPATPAPTPAPMQNNGYQNPPQNNMPAPGPTGYGQIPDGFMPISDDDIPF